MPIKPPTGFATRPEASKLFNRSQRQLERDLDVAYLAEDHEILCRYKLMTKDGQLRDAKDVTTQQVKQLQSDGMIPVWYVETSYLEQEYGRKGEPKPAKSHENVAVTSQKVPNAAENDPAEGQADGGKSQGSPLLFRDAEFLLERVRTLEQLNQQEKQRHDRIVEKLFEQLDVKDKQISAWDEVTQGLTKGLATGQLAPRLLLQADERSNGFWADSDESKQQRVQEAELVEQRDDAERRSQPISSTEKKSGLHSERNPSTTAAVTKNSRASSPEAEDASAPRADALVTETAAVGEGSAPSATMKPPKTKSRKNTRKKSSRKKHVSKKRTRASIRNSETKEPAAQAAAKSAPKPPRKSRGLFSRFFRR